jgi:hypothetical protein
MSEHTPETRVRTTDRPKTSSAFGPRSTVARRLGAGLLALPLAGVVYAGVSHASAPGSDQARNVADVGPAAVAPAGPAKGPSDGSGDESAKRKAYQRFFAEGYDLADAQKLAEVWNIDAQDAKIKAGQKLLDAGAGSTLITDGNNVGDVVKGDGGSSDRPAAHDEAQDRRAYEQFFAEGYDLADAQKLAEVWNIDAQDAKIKAGQKLLDAGAGSTLITDGDHVGDVSRGDGGS